MDECCSQRRDLIDVMGYCAMLSRRMYAIKADSLTNRTFTVGCRSGVPDGSLQPSLSALIVAKTSLATLKQLSMGFMRELFT